MLGTKKNEDLSLPLSEEIKLANDHWSWAFIKDKKVCKAEWWRVILFNKYCRKNKRGSFPYKNIHIQKQGHGGLH